MERSYRQWSYLGLLLATLLASGCDQTPAGRSQLVLVPPAVMEDLGRTAFAEIQQSVPVSDDVQLNQLVACVAGRVIDVLPERYPGPSVTAGWEVLVFDEPVPNAFALPGGRIGIHRGMLDVATDEHQLAAVIAHEVAHLAARHGNERLTQQLGINGILLLVGFFTEVDSGLMLQALGMGAHLGITLPFSRVHETEADLMGLELMAAAGFDPAASLRLWRNMSERSAAQPFEFLSTHPAHESRMKDLAGHMPVASAIRARVPAGTASCAAGAG